MTNYDLLKILGNIDRKYYDEALGGAPEKPLKIDVSRKPMKWYRIAAPIAACLVICAGIIAAPRIIENMQSVNSDPVSAISEPTSQNSSNSQDQENSSNSQDRDNSSNSQEQDNSSNSQEEQNSQNSSTPEILGNYYEEYPPYDIGKVPMTGRDIDYYPADNDVTNIKPEDRVNATLDTAKLGEYDICLSAKNMYLLGEVETVWVEDIGISLVKDGTRISYFSLPARGYRGDYIFEDGKFFVDTFEFDGYNVGAVCNGVYGYLFSVENEEIFALQGTELNYDKIGKDKARFSHPLVKEGDVLADKSEGREYHFYPETFSKNCPKDVANFSTHFHYADAPTTGNFHKDYTDLEYVNRAMPDSASYAARNVILHEVMLRNGRTEDEGYYSANEIEAALVGDNVYRPQGNYLHMDKLSIVLHQSSTILATVDLDMSAVIDEHGEMIVDPDNILVLYHLDDCDILMVRHNNIKNAQSSGGSFTAALNCEKLIRLKGTDKNDNSTVYNIETADNYAAVGNELLDFRSGVKYTFSPEMFDMANAHFRRGTFSPTSTVKGGAPYRYDAVPDYETEMIMGTQDDLDRWYNFIAQAKPAVIHHVFFTYSSDEQRSDVLSDIDAAAIFATIKDTKLATTKFFVNPPVGGVPDPYWYNDYPGFIAFDENGNYLFGIYWVFRSGNEECVEICFDDPGKRYVFDGSKCNLAAALLFAEE